MGKRDKIINFLEEMLLDSEENFRNIIKISSDIIYQLNLITMKYDYVTPSSKEVLGYSPGEIINLGFKGVSSLVHPGDKKKVDKCFNELIAHPLEKNKGSRIEYRFKHGKSDYCWVSETRSVILDDEGAPAAVVGIIRDISESKRAEDKLRQQKEMLEISEKNLRRFSRKILAVREEEKKNLSINLHDEAGAMTVALNSCLDIAKEDLKDHKTESALKNINKAKHVLEKTMEILRKIAVDLRPPVLDEIGLLGALKEFFTNISNFKKISIDFEGKIDDDKLNESVKINMYRVAQESLDNILKHTKAKNVKVRLYSEKNRLKFNISDDGEGFNVAKLKKVNGLKMGIQGMRDRIESFGGVFTIESAPGKGTKTNISLPI